MRRMLAASRGTFSLSIAVCNSPALRDYLVSKLREDDPEYVVVRVPRETENFLDFTRADLGSRTPSAFFLVDLENSLPSTGPRPAIGLLNVTREKWRERFACPVVFWLPEYAVTLLAIEARDFWAWRSHQFEFVAELSESTATGSEAFASGVSAALNLDADRKQFRIAELRERINATGEEPSPEMAPHVTTWLNELGVLLAVVGDLCEAEQMHRTALAIDEKLGRLEGMANQYGNLGIIFKTRGDLDEAEKMYRKALEIDEKLGRLEGMARDYGSLGNIFITRGDLDEAEKMYRKSLEIDEKLGQLACMAITYGNLGIIFQMRGDLDEAEKLHRNALEIDEKLGRLEGIANEHGNLGVISMTRGDLGEAERMYRQALEINEKLGRLEGMANLYGNLGIILEMRGDLDEAGRLWTKARDLFARIGMPHMVEKHQGWLDRLPGAGDDCRAPWGEKE